MFATIALLLAAALQATIYVPVVQIRQSAPIVWASESQQVEPQCSNPEPRVTRQPSLPRVCAPTPGYSRRVEFDLFQRPPPHLL